MLLYVAYGKEWRLNLARVNCKHYVKNILGPVHMHKIYTCKYFAIWSKYAHISKSIFNLRSHANSVHISILKVTLDQLYCDSSHVQTVC